jgi:hypothetical protein
MSSITVFWRSPLGAGAQHGAPERALVALTPTGATERGSKILSRQ